jgi:putative hydrolase of HD superfamily
MHDFDGAISRIKLTSIDAAGDLPCRDDAERDVNMMLESLGLQSIRRYIDQCHWQEESQLAHAADAAEPGLKLENVAAHSWHVADTTMLLASNFPEVDSRHAVELAILHDKLELFTGDLDPVGPDGQGTTSHAFDGSAREAKMTLELAALEHYLSKLRPAVRDRQRSLILETIRSESPEARLVKAIDKLQALTFVLTKKAGTMTDEHLTFSLRYSVKAIEYFPQLVVHYVILVRRLLTNIAEHRHVSIDDIASRLPAAVRPLAVAASA